MTLYEKIPLPNGMTLEVWDYSRQIAAETTKVELVAQIEVEFKASYFSKREYYSKLIKTIGPKDLYEYRKMKSYVKSAEKDAVFQEMLTAFKKDALPYLSRDEFPRQFARSRLRDIEQNWYKYATHDEEG
jgi:hypothetical protein